MASAGPVVAQNWATWEYCDVSDAAIDLNVFPDLDIERAQREAEAISNGIGRFWEIRSQDGAVSYLWGTVHSNSVEHLRLAPAVEAQIKAARVVALEFDFVERDRVALTQRASSEDIYVAQNSDLSWQVTPIADILEPEQLDWLNDRLKGIGFPDGSAPFIKLGVLAEMLLNDPCNDFAAGIYPIQDSYIQLLGNIAGAEIIGLEPTDNLRQKLGDRKNRKLTLDMIRLYVSGLNPNITNEQMRTWTALWKSGQTALPLTIEREYLRNLLGDNRGPDIQTTVDAYLLDERNVIFADRIDADLKRGGVFMAIGGSHIAGQNGIVDLLRRRGYTVARIPLPSEISP